MGPFRLRKLKELSYNIIDEEFTLRWTDAIGRLCKQIADLVEEEGRVSHGDK